MRLRMLCGSLLLGVLLVPRSAAVRAADAASDEFAQQIVKLIGDKDREFRAAGLEQVRTAAHGSAFTQLFAAQLTKLSPDGQIALLDALADRRDVAARPAVLELFASSKDSSVRAAAVGALGKLGEPADLPLLIKSLGHGSRVERDAARESLTQISGESINKSLAERVRSASPDVKLALVEVLATRRASDQFPTFVAASVDERERVRRAAMKAFGQLGRPDQIVQMLPGVLKAEKGSERDVAEQEVAIVCDRIANEDQRANALIAAVNTVNITQRDQLLPLIGRVGGKKLLAFVTGIAAGNDAARRELAIDALTKWPDASVADKLLEIATRATDPAQRKIAFAGYVKVSAARDDRSDRERLDRLKQAMQAARTPEEILLVINRIRTAYDVESVRFLLPYLDKPQFAQAACETIVEIAHHREVRDPNKAEFDKALNKVIATSKDPEVVERAKRYQRGETWARRPRRKG